MTSLCRYMSYLWRHQENIVMTAVMTTKFAPRNLPLEIILPLLLPNELLGDARHKKCIWVFWIFFGKYISYIIFLYVCMCVRVFLGNRWTVCSEICQGAGKISSKLFGPMVVLLDNISFFTGQILRSWKFDGNIIKILQFLVVH